MQTKMPSLITGTEVILWRGQQCSEPAFKRSPELPQTDYVDRRNGNSDYNISDLYWTNCIYWCDRTPRGQL